MPKMLEKQEVVKVYSLKFSLYCPFIPEKNAARFNQFS